MSLLIIAGAVTAIVILAALAALAFVIDNRVGQAVEAYDRRTRALERQAQALELAGANVGSGIHGIAGAISNASYQVTEVARQRMMQP